MVYSKRGVPITLRYYWVDESLWRERNEQMGLAWQAVREAREAAAKASDHGRLKALPNIDVNMERLLWREQISATPMTCGCKALNAAISACCNNRANLGLRVLSLGGAIADYHQALPTELQRTGALVSIALMAVRHGHEPVVQGPSSEP